MTKKFYWDDPLDNGITRFEKELDPLPIKPLLMDDLPIEKDDHFIERRRHPTRTPLIIDGTFFERRRY